MALASLVFINGASRGKSKGGERAEWGVAYLRDCIFEEAMNMGQEMTKKGEEVEIIEESLVHPDLPPPVTTMYLPALDAMWSPHYPSCLLFYRIHPDHFASLVDLLLSSLRHTLTHFYPWSGCLARSSVPPGRLVIDFTKESGVEFIVASTNASYLDLLQDNFQLRPFFFAKLCKRSRPDGRSQFHDMPLLSIQVTEFRDGGIALGCVHSHTVADACSIWQFMKSWSECARGLPISSPPLHERDRFLLHNPSEKHAWTPFDDLVPYKEDLHAKAHTSKEEDSTLSQRCFHFTAQMVHSLKALASEGPGAGGGAAFSTYELLCAHFWKHVTEARVLQPSTHIHLLVLANCRTRVNPPLPLSYFGNCVGTAIVQTTVGEILTESLAATALRVRGGVKISTDENNLHRYSHWLELHDNSMNSLVLPKSVGIIVASSPRLPCYEVDFGHTIGIPESVRTSHIKGDGEMVLFPSRHAGNIDICMALKPQVMDRLLSDPYFLNM